jgi:ribosomal subunit interface protein
MQVPLQLTLRNLSHSDALEQRIRQKIDKLEALSHRITSFAVTVESRHRHQQQGREFAVSLDVRLPGREIVVNREHDEDVYVALRDAFDALRRQLDELARIQRGEVKSRRAAGGAA